LLKLSRYNLDDPEVTEAEKKKDFEEETKKLEAKYQMSDFDDELSMCVVIHASAHKKNYAHEYVLNSIFNQNYSEYIVVYIADGFDADEVQPIKEFIKKKDRFKQNVKLVWNNEKKYFLESTITAIRAFCMEKRVTVLMDGDDELLGSQVFNVINTFYRKYNLNMAYGNFIEYHETQEVMRIGFSTEYEDTEKRDNSYRSVGQKFGSVKTFKTRLVSFIKESDLKDSTGGYYKYAGDYALLYPLL
jgi:glycosyltransferase involved in cell wall biosynthesis